MGCNPEEVINMIPYMKKEDLQEENVKYNKRKTDTYTTDEVIDIIRAIIRSEDSGKGYRH